MFDKTKWYLAFAMMLSLCLLGGCNDAGPQSLEIPADNPYQQTPEEIAKYNADGASKAKEMRANATP